MHHEKHFSQSEVVRDVVIGMSDGLTVPFALAAGLSGVLSDNHLILIAGIAEISAGSIAMGLGGYLAGQTEIDHYNSEEKREYEEIITKYEFEKQEVRYVFKEYGLSEESQNIISDELAKDEKKWVDFMMKFELGLEKPDAKRATKSAFNIGIAYIVGGIIPLMGYMFTSNTIMGLRFSAAITIVCLFIFGYYKSKLTGQQPIKGALRVTFIGIVAALAAYVIASLVKQ